jgi:hypothetical protein
MAEIILRWKLATDRDPVAVEAALDRLVALLAKIDHAADPSHDGVTDPAQSAAAPAARRAGGRHG